MKRDVIKKVLSRILWVAGAKRTRSDRAFVTKVSGFGFQD